MEIGNLKKKIAIDIAIGLGLMVVRFTLFASVTLTVLIPVHYLMGGHISTLFVLGMASFLSFVYMTYMEIRKVVILTNNVHVNLEAERDFRERYPAKEDKPKIPPVVLPSLKITYKSEKPKPKLPDWKPQIDGDK